MVRNILEKLIYLSVFSLLISSPLPFGSVKPWARFVLELQAFLLFFLWLLWSFHDEEAFKIRIKNLIPLFFFLLICLFQVIPLPRSVLGVLSEKSLEIWERNESLLSSVGFPNGGSVFTISLYSHATWRETILLLSYVAFGFVVSRVFRSDRRLKILLIPVLAASIFQAAYGIYQYLMDISNSAYPNLISATGTFVNRNHFAGFLEMCIPLALGYAVSLSAWQREKKALWKTMVSSDNIYRQVLFLFLVGIMVLALIFSKSRMGIFSVLLSLVFFSIIHPSLKKRGIRMGRMLLFVLAVSILYGLWIGLYSVFERFLQIEGDAPGRILVWKDTLKAIRDFPLFGTGFGTFGYVYPLYKRSMEQALVYTYAHNDYLQLIVETGFLGFLSIVTALLLLIISSLRALNRFSQGGDYSRFFLTLGALTGIVSILIHSLTDFNLHIPSNALYFAFLIGFLKAACDETRRTEATERVRVRRKRRMRTNYDDYVTSHQLTVQG
ncbi:MAG TPA: O-antigen ligase family protein [Thermodesulfobacteriota bacterium]|nr:O-antigen ligase family protein [Thermodesulfobacteriota bacterium]